MPIFKLNCSNIKKFLVHQFSIEYPSFPPQCDEVPAAAAEEDNAAVPQLRR